MPPVPARLACCLLGLLGSVSLPASARGQVTQPAPAAEPAAPEFRPKAPDEVVSEGTRSARKFIVGDMVRTGLVTAVEQGRRGVLRVGIGRSFQSSPNREFHFAKLASAYHEWTVQNQPLVIELWDRGGKFGEYINGSFLTDPGHTTPLDCSDGATGLCGQPGQASAGPPTEPAPQAPPPRQPVSSTGEAPARGGRAAGGQSSGRSGFRFGLGLGGGSADLSCGACRIERKSAISGYLSLAHSIGHRALVGIEGTGWIRDQSEHTAQVYSAMAQVTGYPSLTGGLFLSAGLGLVGYRSGTEFGDVSATGFGVSGRVGYEVSTGGSVFIVPYVGYLTTLGRADFDLEGYDLGEFGINNFQFGLGLGID